MSHSAATSPIEQARQIASHPTAAHSRTQRVLAWAILKSARGQTIRQSRIHASAPRQA